MVSYRIDPSPIGADGQPLRCEWEATIVVVGCGGTGSFLAESICRLLIGRRSRVYLVDLDRVEANNVGRQAFDRVDVGRFKAQVLAKRLARRFEREVGYSVLPYDRQLHAQVFARGPSRLSLLVGCVDNAAARRAIAATLDSPSAGNVYPHPGGFVWWLDCGNGRNSGQALLGNVARPEALRGAFLPEVGLCRALPAPSLQRPDLLDAPPQPKQADCAGAIAMGDQGPTVNQAVAALSASYVENLLADKCCWMATYFDIEDGALRCVPADPKSVAAIAGLRPNTVVSPHAEYSRHQAAALTSVE